MGIDVIKIPPVKRPPVTLISMQFVPHPCDAEAKDVADAKCSRGQLPPKADTEVFVVLRGGVGEVFAMTPDPRRIGKLGAGSEAIVAWCQAHHQGVRGKVVESGDSTFRISFAA